MAIKFAVSLNENDEAERKIIDAIAMTGEKPARVIKEALRRYLLDGEDVQTIEECQQAPAAQSDSADVVDAINAGFAMLAELLQDRQVVSAQPAEFGAQDDLRGYETAQDAEDRLIAEGMPEAALLALKTRVFKPGMRLEN
jgi:hypothetical protein